LLATAFILAACESPNTGGPPRRDVTPVEFGKLRWVTGTWWGQERADDYAKAPFYETWRAVDDSTLVMHRFTDSTLTTVSDSVRIELRGGTVNYRDGKQVMPLIGVAGRSFIFFPEGQTRGGVTFGTDVACTDTLALATAPCDRGPDTLKTQTLFWWGAYWHTGRLVGGHTVGGSLHHVYNPVWRRER
jgi:hypothetical protein